MAQPIFKPVMVLSEIVGGVSAWIVNEVQDVLFWKVLPELLSVATSYDVMLVQFLNMVL